MSLPKLLSFAHRLKTLGLWPAASLLLGGAAFAQSPAPDPLQGDGRVSAFYQWSEPVVGKAGQLLNSEPLPSELGLPEAGIQKRILHIDRWR